MFQPIVDLASGRVVGHEALSRFDPAVPLSVDGWFEIADRAGMCVELEVACIAAVVDALAGGDALAGYVALNVSPKTLIEHDFAGLPDRADRGGWVLEITEHSEVTDYPALAQRVRELQDRGFRIARHLLAVGLGLQGNSVAPAQRDIGGAGRQYADEVRNKVGVAVPRDAFAQGAPDRQAVEPGIGQRQRLHRDRVISVRGAERLMHRSDQRRFERQDADAVTGGAFGE